MAKRPTVSSITSGHASITALNANFTALKEGFDNTLSRDGSSPNTMSADIDLNGNDLNNVAALKNTSGQDIVALTQGYMNSAATSATASATSATASATSASASASSATTSENYGNKVDGAVAGSNFSSKAWAIGGTGITDTAGKGPAKDWAIETTGAVDGTNHSAKAWAVGGTGVTDTSSAGAAKEWATETASSVDTSEYSAKEYAVGTQRRGAASGGSAKDWATYTGGTVDNAGYSAKYWATQASNAATTASNNANQSINAFYLGHATSDPSTDANGDALTSGDFYFNTATNVTRFFNEGSSSFVNGAAAGDAFEPAGNSLALAIALG